MTATLSASLTGTITVDYSQTISDGIIGDVLTSVSGSDIEVDGGLTIPFSVVALPLAGWQYWSSPSTWNDGGIFGLTDAGINLVALIAGVVSADPGALLAVQPAVNSLEQIGPTNRNLPIPSAIAVSYEGISFQVGASVGISYSVTIPAGSMVQMDQANVDVNSLTISSGGTLSAGSQSLTVDTKVNNFGSFQVVGSLPLIISGIFANEGSTSIGQGGTLIDQGSIANGDTISVFSGGSLVDDGAITNAGTFSINGALDLNGSSIENVDGLIEALPGGVVQAENVVITAGTLATSGTGLIQVGGILSDVTIASAAAIAISGGSTAILSGTIVNEGTFELYGTTYVSSGGWAAELQISGTVELTGGGVISLNGQPANNYITSPLNTPVTLINEDNTIHGSGIIGYALSYGADYGELTLINKGTVDAEGGTGLGLYLGANWENTGLMQASDGGTLTIFGPGSLDNTSGTIQALANSTVELQSEVDFGLVQASNQGWIGADSLIYKAEVETSGSGVIDAGGGLAYLTISPNASLLVDGQITDVTISHGDVLSISGGSTAILSGTIVNEGTFELYGTTYVSSGGWAAELQISGTVELTGGGVISLNGQPANNYITSPLNTPVTLINEDNTIHGSGIIGYALSYGADYGELTLINKGTVDAEGGTGLGLYLGANWENTGLMQASDGGTLTIFGPGSLDNTSGTIQALANSTVELQSEVDFGLVQAEASALVELSYGIMINDSTMIAQTGGTVSIAGMVSGGLIQADIGATIEATQATLASALLSGSGSIKGSVVNVESLTVKGSGTLYLDSTISGSGLLIQEGGATDLEETSSYSGGTKIKGGTLILNAPGAAGSGTISFVASADPILAFSLADLPNNTIESFTAGDTIEILGANADSAFLSDGILSILNQGNTIGDLLLSSSPNIFRVTETDGNAFITMPCFLRCTRITTPSGEVVVEDLQIGDRVLTATGQARPVRWIGCRAYAGRFLRGNRHALPILIRAGALADNVPHRDLHVSPNHAMFIDGALIPATCLVNGSSIVQLESLEKVEYFHLELDTHDILLAEGAPAESFIDDESRGMFHNAAEYAALYPDAVPAPARYCAPRLEDGPELEAIRQRLLARARDSRMEARAA